MDNFTDIQDQITKIFDQLKIKFYSKTNKDKNVAWYLCIFTKKDGTKFPFRVSISPNNCTLVFFSEDTIYFDTEKKIEVYDIINKYNIRNVYGTLAVKFDNQIRYSMGLSLEGENITLIKEQIFDYIQNMTDYVKEVLEEIKDKNYLIESPTNEIAATNGVAK